jgi:hypothetical protein
MSKLLTDSKVLMDLLFLGADANDTTIHCTIDELKKCAFDCMEMRITGYTLSKEEKDKLDGFNTVFVETWRMLADLENDFKDLIDEHFKQFEEQAKKGGGA